MLKAHVYFMSAPQSKLPVLSVGRMEGEMNKFVLNINLQTVLLRGHAGRFARADDRIIPAPS